MLNIGGGGKQYDLPAMASGDTQVFLPNAHTNHLSTVTHCTMLVTCPGVLELSSIDHSLTMVVISQVPMQMWKNMFTRYHDYTMRFTMG